MVEDVIKIAKIANGTVIDHITSGQALNVLKIIGVNEYNIDSTIDVAMHVPSKHDQSGWKDIVKIEDRELDQETVDKIALISPDATISTIRNFSVFMKYQVRIDEHVKGLVRCSNPNCITNIGEPVEPEFDVVNRNPPILKCMYCERCISNISENLL